MAKWWTGGTLLGAWLGLAAGAFAQTPPVPPRTPMGPEPLPTVPSGGNMSPYIVGPLTSRNAPPGPDSSMSLPDNLNNAFYGEPENIAEVIGGFRANIGLLLMRPALGQERAFTVITANGNQQRDFTFDVGPGIFGELEYLWDIGWGIRGRVSHYEQGATNERFVNTDPAVRVESDAPMPGFQVISPIFTNIAPLLPSIRNSALVFPVPGSLLAAGVGADVMDFGSKIDITTGDVEVTRYVTFDSSQFLVTVGARVAELKQTYRVTRMNGIGSFNFNTFDTDNPPDTDIVILSAFKDFAVLEFEQVFRGGGPMFSLEYRQDIGYGFNLYGNVRPALLIGQTRRSAVFNAEFSGIQQNGTGGGSDNPDFPFILVTQKFSITRNFNEIQSKTRVIPAIDFELGAEWNIGGGGTGGPQPILQTSFVTQTYYNLGNISRDNGTVYLMGLRINFGVQF